MDAFADLQVDKGDERVSEAVGGPEAEDVIEDHGVVDVEAQWLTFLRTDQDGGVDLYFIHPVEGKDDPTAYEIVAGLADLTHQGFERVEHFVVQDKRHGEPEEVILLVEVKTRTEVRLELVGEIVKREVSLRLQVEVAEVSTDQVDTRLQSHGQRGVSHVNLVRVVPIDIVVPIASDFVVVHHKSHADPVLHKGCM